MDTPFGAHFPRRLADCRNCLRRRDFSCARIVPAAPAWGRDRRGYPFTTATGRSRATIREIPARSTTPTTSATSL